MFRFAEPPPRRRISLTPMIDVVFLLLVFFMLVARFGLDHSMPLGSSVAGASWSGPPRLVDVSPGGLRLNGVPLYEAELFAELGRLVASPSDTVVVRPRDGATVQHLIDLMTALERAGFVRLALVEGS